MNDFHGVLSGEYAFKSTPTNAGATSSSSSLPVFDKPLFDADHTAFHHLVSGLGRTEPQFDANDAPHFDDLLPATNRNPLDIGWDNKPAGRGTSKATTDMENPFAALKSSSSGGPSTQALFDDSLEQSSTFADSNSNKSENVFSGGGLFDDIDPLGGSSSKKSENISASSGLFDDVDPLNGLGNSAPMNDKEKVGSPDRLGTTVSSSGETSARAEKKISAEEYHASPSFDTYSASVDSHRSAPNTYPSSSVNASDDTTSQRHTSSVYDSNLDSSDDVYLSVSEIPLFTQPTAAPPPSRPPPPKPPRISRAGSNAPSYAKKKIDDHSSFPSSSQFFQNPRLALAGGKSSFASPVDGHSDVLSGDGLERYSDAARSASAMKEAVDMAEAGFKHAKEARERGTAKSARMLQQEREDKRVLDFQDRELRERQEGGRHLMEEEERKKRDEEERVHREMEEKERKQRRIERERVERERVRQAVERATREARERAAADALIRAEKAAVGKAQAEARERAERAAVFKAQAEARERAGRAAAEAKQRADREKAEREAREKAEREAREKSELEAKEKEARDKAAAAARANQQRNENDLESFFGMGSHASNAPRPMASSSDPLFDSQFPKKQSGSARTSVRSTASMRKTSSSTNVVDDLSSIFGGAPSAGEFQEFEGETEERRNARLHRHQRTQDRTAKALAEKNQRDLEAQNEQAERHRIGETLDVEVKRWSAGKEGNLRALLSTLQYVLWAECGWQPVSLTDLITGASVKKAYRKATLCIHPDKVQQKGATLQQKYVAEKVFDLLKEAWSKFDSEELF